MLFRKGLASPTFTSLIPFFGILTVGLVIFSIVGVVILALIPIYVPKIDVAASNSSVLSRFYMVVSGGTTDDSSVSGTVVDTSSLSSSLSTSDLLTVSSGETFESGERRRRDLRTGRVRREVSHDILLECYPKANPGCSNAQCISNYLDSLFTRINQRFSSNRNVSMSIYSSGAITSHTFTLKSPTLYKTRPTRFGNGTTTSFVAAQSGLFNSSSTWTNGIIPYSNGSVLIPSGITVTIARGVLRTPVSVIDVYGTLELGTNSSVFQFYGALALSIYSGGYLRDLTTNKTILAPTSSVFSVYTNGSLSDNTTFQTYTVSRAISLGAKQTLGRSGPGTVAMLPDFSVVSYPRVTFIAIRSGSFLSRSSYLRGIPISAAACARAGVCGMTVANGATVTTEDLGDTLSFPVNTIDILSGATLNLGSSSSTNPFTFSYAINVLTRGVLQALGTGGKIRIPPNSGWNIFSGGSFRSTVSTELASYNLTQGVPVDIERFPLGMLYSNALEILVSILGALGARNNTASTVPSVTSIIG